MTDELKRVIAEMVEVEGIYLVEDPAAPGCYVVVQSTGGKLLALAPTHELAPDRFFPRVKIVTLFVVPP